MTEEMAASPEEMAFGEALAELESIVQALESGQLELEESMTRYERGVALLRALQTKLTDAQQRDHDAARGARGRGRISRRVVCTSRP